MPFFGVPAILHDCFFLFKVWMGLWFFVFFVVRCVWCFAGVSAWVVHCAFLCGRGGMMREWVARRSAFLADIRAFFAARGVLEVDTPLWRECGVTDAQLVSVAVAEGGFLQTSPEFAMKRLLSCGAGDIYQLAHVFRGEEAGRRHLREFMMLEWYRLGFDHWQLMEEVADLVRVLLPQAGAVRHTPYRRTFVEHLGVDVAALDAAGLRAFCVERLPECAAWQLGRDGWLDLLFTHFVEPFLGQDGLEFVVDYPPSQAALARVLEVDGERVAARFELYVMGMELCNGFWELADADEQRARFAADNAERQALGLPLMAVDEGFLAALEAGLPPCAGVALGVDRLLMLATGAAHIGEVALCF